MSYYMGSMTTQPAPADPGYSIMPLPKTTDGQPAPTITPAPANPLDALGGFLDQSVFGIPVKWLLIGAAAWFMLKR